MNKPHIVHAFDDQLRTIKAAVEDIARRADAQLATAIAALTERDASKAAEVERSDSELDAGFHRVEELIFELLALRQPMAQDLRLPFAAMRGARDIERMGDYAKNIAKHTVSLTRFPPTGIEANLATLAEAVKQMVEKVIVAFAEQDPDLAQEVRSRDADVDAIYSQLFEQLLNNLAASRDESSACVHQLFIARSFERIGDHATNFAEDVLFIVHGAPPESSRVKLDTSHYAVADRETKD